MKKQKEKETKPESALVEAVCTGAGLILYRIFLKSDNSFQSILIGALCGVIGCVVGMGIKALVKKIKSK